jgi:hypothetical protein
MWMLGASSFLLDVAHTVVNASTQARWLTGEMVHSSQDLVLTIISPTSLAQPAVGTLGSLSRSQQ